jgi:hypothetical protein
MNRIALAASAVAVLSLVPCAALADDARPGYAPPHETEYTGGSIPSYAHIEERTNPKLIEGGLGLTGSVYGISVLYALATCGAQVDCRPGSQWLYAPVIGPFLTAVQAPTSGGQALSVFDGALQLTGIVMAAAGIYLPRKVVVWQDQAATVSVAPAPVGDGTGVAVSVTTL